MDRPHTVLTQLSFLISNIRVEEEAIGAKRQGWTGRTQPLLNYRTFPNIRAVRSGIRSVPEIEPIHPKVKFLSLAEEMSLSQIVDILNFFLKTTNCDCPAED